MTIQSSPSTLQQISEVVHHEYCGHLMNCFFAVLKETNTHGSVNEVTWIRKIIFDYLDIQHEITLSHFCCVANSIFMRKES